jgi:ATP-dependent DNA helicase RecQ
MPTGGGKSITFQVPALTMDGVCIVITPLIALMKDQVMHLKQRGIRAEAIYSGLTHDDILRILDNASYGAVKFLYVSPERLSSPLFLSKMQYIDVCFITVDEAHCISQWGYDFRPSYLQIDKIRELLPETPVLALTATATPQVIEDIQDKLQFGKHTKGKTGFYKMSFKRNNLSYVVRYAEDKYEEMVHILQSVNGSAIVYTRNRKRTKELAEVLNANDISATFYHAGLDFAIKDTRQQEWQENKYRVMVATNAFGMGIDKPDVRLVIHFDCPDSLEAYFQEAGRAGRDGMRSYAVLLYNKDDNRKLLRHADNAFPQKEYIHKVYDNLAYYFELPLYTGEGARFEFNEEVFCTRFHHYPTSLEAALSILQNAGYIEYDPEPDSNPRILITVPRSELYDVAGLSKTEEEVLTTLLRYYGTLFTSLTFINVALIASACKIDEQRMHIALKNLATRGIVRYVPRRNVPIITYVIQRIPSNDLIISKNIYEELHKRMVERVGAVIRYLESEDICRSTLLLEYFGELDAEPCNHCDVCIEHKDKPHKPESENSLLQLLSDHKEHHIDELVKAYKIPQKVFEEEIEHLRQEELITISYPYIRLKD